MLKEKIVRLLKDYPGILDMRYAMRTSSVIIGGFAFGLEGLILKAAGYHLQGCELDGNLRLPLNAPVLLRSWVDYEKRMHPYAPAEILEINATARQVWEAEYGEQEALELPFYSEETTGVTTMRWWDSYDVDVGEVIVFLQTGHTHALNGPTGKMRR